MTHDATNIPSSLIGRDNELAELSEILGTAIKREARCILVSGETGTGKTRLVEELLNSAHIPAIHGRAREESRAPYEPLVQALRECARLFADSLHVDPRFRPHLSLLLPELDSPPPLSNPEALLEAVASVFGSILQDTPLAIHIDDIQWADNATLEMLPVLFERLRTLPVLLIATYSSEDITRGHPVRRFRSELRRSRRLHECTLTPLSREDSERVAEGIIGGPPDRALSDLLFDHTGGTPLYIEELSRALISGGRLRDTEQGWSLLTGERLPIPESVRDVVLLRLETLSAPARSCAEVAAILGNEFELSMLCRLAGDDCGLGELIERAIIRDLDARRGAFRHTLLRQVIRSEIPWTRRRELHRQTGELLEASGAPPEAVTDHWLEAGETERARIALLAAAERFCHVHAYRDAASLATRALDIWPARDNDEERVTALERAAHCAQLSGQLTEAVRLWREALDSDIMNDDARRRGEACRSLATVYTLQGVWDQAIRTRTRAADAMKEAGLPGEAAAELFAAAGRLTANLQLSAANDTAVEAIALAESAGQYDIMARALGLQGDVVAMLGDIDEGRKLTQRALSLALEHNASEAASDVYRRLAATYASASDYPGAVQAYATAVDFCRTEGVDVHTQVCLSCMSYVLFMTGDWKRALEVCQEVYDAKETPDNSRITILGVQGLIRTYRGESRIARKQLDETLSESRRRDLMGMELLSVWGLAVLEEDEGNTKSAEAHYRHLIEVWRTSGDRHDAIPALCRAATFFATQQMEAETGQCAEALATIASANANPEALAGLAYGLAELSLLNDNTEDALHQLQQAVNHLRSLDIPVSRAQTERRYGYALSRAGNHGKAVEVLRSAYRTARKLGARPLAAGIAAELAGLGETAEERRPGEPVAETGNLTGRQKEVLGLMADGLTNKEIGQKMFLSARTVDMHVGNILARLDCRTRTEAVRRAADLGILPPA